MPHRPLLVAVHLGGVDVAVADLEGLADVAAVSAGGTWKAPNPSWGIDVQSLRAMFGTVMPRPYTRASRRIPLARRRGGEPRLEAVAHDTDTSPAPAPLDLPGSGDWLAWVTDRGRDSELAEARSATSTSSRPPPAGRSTCSTPGTTAEIAIGTPQALPLWAEVHPDAAVRDPGRRG